MGLHLFQKGHIRHTNNRFQYMPSSNVYQVLMYVNVCQNVPQNARDYKACQHMQGECYAMLGSANMCLGVLVMAKCSRYKDVKINARSQGMLLCSKSY